MGAKFIKPEELGREISKIIEEYTEEVSNAIEEEIDKTAKEVKEEIQATAPEKTSKYSKGFAIKKDDTRGTTSRIIYNKSKPGLIHLLELGYAKRGGKGRVAGRPHLRPAYEKIVPKMEKKIENIIKKGGK